MHNMCLVRPALLYLNVHDLKVFYEQINYYYTTTAAATAPAAIQLSKSFSTMCFSIDRRVHCL